MIDNELTDNPTNKKMTQNHRNTNQMKIKVILNAVIVLASVLLFPHSVYAQQSMVKGTVRDNQGNTIPGVSVIVEDTSSGTYTDADGVYSIEVPKGGTSLRFSFIGYKTLSLAISGRQIIDAVLEEDSMRLEEIVVLGYGQQKKSDLSGAIVNVSVADLEDVASPSLVSSLGGRLAGVYVQQNGGGPNPGTTIRIRGTGTLNDNNPLVVIDDIIGADLDAVSPTDIETMTVLKDASAAAIYGSRAASGVIIIKTKRGRDEMAPKVRYDGYFGVSQRTKKMAMLTASEIAMIYNEASANDGSAGMAEFKDPSAMKDVTDWQDEVFRTATVSSHNVSLAGGGKANNYNLSFNAQDYDGILENTYNKKYSLRVNSDYKIGRKFRFGESMNLSYKNRRGVDTRNDNGGALITTLAYHPDVPVYNEDGTYHGVLSTNYGDLRNPVGIFKRNTQRNRTYGLEGTAYLQYEILPGLNAKVQGTLKFFDTDNKNFNVKEPEPGKPSFNNGLSQFRSIYIGWVNDAFLYFDKEIGKHKINAMAGFSAMHNESEDVTANKEGFAFEFPSFQYLNAGTMNPTCYGGYGEDALMSAMTRVNYTYNDKYILSTSMRYDGSSKFAKGKRWGFFPSISAAWRMTREDFMRNVSWLDDLKLRASYGSLGNQSVASYMYMARYETSTPFGRYSFGPGTQTLTQGYYAGVMANPDLTWETTTQSNIGIDAALAGSRILVNFDYYIKDTKDILVSPPALGAYGSIGNQLINGATVRNHGFETTIEYRGHSKDFTYDVSFNISSYRNKVRSLGNNSQPIYGPSYRDAFTITKTEVGLPIGFFYGYKTDGIFQSDEEALAYKNSKGETMQPNAKAGDFKFKDVNCDGTIDAEDKVNLGDAVPDFCYGANINLGYKGFDLNIFLQGVQGVDIWNATKYTFGFTSQKYNYYKSILDRWTPENKDTDVPRVTWMDPNNNKRPSDYYIEDGSFLRCKNITIGYTIPKNITGRIGIEKIRVYASALNPFTLTKYSGFDPELGITDGADTESNVDRGQYPQARTISFGLNIIF